MKYENLIFPLLSTRPGMNMIMNVNISTIGYKALESVCKLVIVDFLHVIFLSK